MAQPVAHYDGNYITCYPGSNQSDDGKLNMEFNMARLVTRVTSKNFCTVKPSYELSIVPSNTGRPQIQVGVGQCSINGMDLIMSSSIIIAEPETAGDYYLIFKLYRDGSDNVRGDDVYGVTTTFMGVYLTYVTEKPDPQTDKDVLYLGKFHYDGETITDLEEDEDKYGRIWAEDILCKVEDSKHPDITRLNLQELIYKLPDWYVSKEGDVEFGAIDFMATRLTEGSYGIHIQATSDNNSELIMKAPILTTEEENNILKVFAKNTGIEINIGKSILSSGTGIGHNNELLLNTPNPVEFTSDDSFYIWGKNGGVALRAGNDGFSPYLIMNNNSAILRGSEGDLEDSVIFTDTTLKHSIGKAEFTYDNSNNYLTLGNAGTMRFRVYPDIDIINDMRVRNTLYLGNESNYGREATYLTPEEWVLSDGNATTTFTPSTILVGDDVSDNAYIQVGKFSSSSYSKMTNNGSIILSSTDGTAGINLVQGKSGYSVSIYKAPNSNNLSIAADTTKVMGDLEAYGDIRANKVYNAVYNGFGEIFRKDKNEVIEYGDVVCIGEDGLAHKVNSEKDLNTIIGICSNTIGVQMGGKGIPKDEQLEVEMLGQIWVKTKENNIKPGQLVKVNTDATVSVTTNKEEKFGITLTDVINGKVLIVYNG